MQLPEHPFSLPLSSASQTVFGGLARNVDGAGGEIAWGENLSGHNTPALTPRLPQEKLADYSAPTALYAWDKLVVVDDGKLYYDGDPLTDVSPGAKQFAVVGQTLIVWPDKITVNLATQNVRQMEASYTATTEATFTTTTLKALHHPVDETKTETCSMKGKMPYIRVYTALSFENGQWTKTGGRNIIAPDLSEGDLFIPYKTPAGDFLPNIGWIYDNEAGSDYKYQDNNKGYYCQMDAELKRDFTTYPTGASGVYKFRYILKSFSVINPLLSDLFSPGEAIAITGCTEHTGNNVTNATIISVDDTTNTLTFPPDTFSGDGDSWTDGPVTVTRVIPHMDLICEKDNRLWGVSNENKTIYASGLGAPMTYSDFSGLSTDSYTVALSGPGDFTGLCNYSDNLLAFKEHSLHRIAGDYPAQYTLYNSVIEGVAKGSHHSLSIVNDVLYYQGVAGVYGYTGGQPTVLSHPLGNQLGKNAVAGSDHRRYYLSWQRDHTWETLAYDTYTGQWHPWNLAQICGMAQAESQVYFATADGVWKIDSGEEAVSWQCRLWPYDENSMNYKQYHTLTLTAELGEGDLSLSVLWDDGTEAHVFTHNTPGRFTEKIYLPFHRTRTMALVLEGTGPCQIHEITRAFLPYD